MRAAGSGSLTRESCATVVRIQSAHRAGECSATTGRCGGKRPRMFPAVGYEAVTVSAHAAISARRLSMRSLRA